MNILFIGDIFGRSGRKAVKHFVPLFREQAGIDLVVANGENACHGNGLNLITYQELREAGVDWITGGDHSFAQKEFLPLMDDPKIQVLRPANYPDAPGKGMAVCEFGGQKVTVINLQGRVFMKEQIDNPFHVFDALIQESEGFILVDFHAEATSEKNAFGYFVDGRAGAIVGTHTHVQTADERVLPGGTAYISDVGMTGPHQGVIGVDYNEVIASYLKGIPFRLEPAGGPAQFNAVIIKTKGKYAKSISRIFEVTEN